MNTSLSNLNQYTRVASFELKLNKNSNKLMRIIRSPYLYYWSTNNELKVFMRLEQNGCEFS